LFSHEATGLSARAFGFARGEGKPTFPNTALSRFLVYSVQLLCLGIELASQGHLRVSPVALESVPGEWGGQVRFKRTSWDALGTLVFVRKVSESLHWGPCFFARNAR
jgi:hypothetical protein